MIDRVVYIDQTVEITMPFLENGVVVAPSDPSLYPNYSVKDINGDIVSFGVGSIGPDDVYHATWTVPSDSLLSTPQSKWSVDWEMLGSNGKRYRGTEYFDVAHPTFGQEEFKEQQKLFLASRANTLTLPLPAQPTSISFTLYDVSEQTILNATPTLSGLYNEYYIYEVIIPAGTTTAGSDYSGVWEYSFSSGGSTDIYYMKIMSVDVFALGLVSDLRMYLDKTLKSIGLSIGYRDSDLYHYLRMGVNVVNYVPPPTTWNFSYIRNINLNHILVMASAWYALNAQFLAEGDMAFNYSGQAVTLESDKTAMISEAIERINGYLNDTFMLQKKFYIHGQQKFHLGITAPSVGRQQQALVQTPLNIQRLVFPRLL
jgi:hypothetical protein